MVSIINSSIDFIDALIYETYFQEPPDDWSAMASEENSSVWSGAYMVKKHLRFPDGGAGPSYPSIKSANPHSD